MTNSMAFVILGILAGILSGLIGIGGGLIIIPALVFGFGFNQHTAQGTTLALMVPPIGILAAWTYYKGGYVDIRVASLICLGFVFGGLAGARIATHISNAVLEKMFGAALLAVSLKMIFGK